MINLIPLSAKRNVAFEYWTRVTSVGFMILSGIIFASTLLLLPVYVRINSQISVYAGSVEEAKGKASRYDLSASELIKSSKQARLVLDLHKEIHFTAIASLLNSFTNDQITIDNFTFTRDTQGIKPIQISGKSKTRQSLADFRKTLLENDSIEEVFLPISNLTQDKDISFKLTVTMKKPI